MPCLTDVDRDLNLHADEVIPLGDDVSDGLINKAAAAQRLKQARIAAGFASAADAAHRFGWTASTYNSHENMQNPIRPHVAERYAKAFKVNPKWILFGDDSLTISTDDEDTATLEIRGDVVAGAFKEPGAPSSRGASDVVSDPRFPKEAQFVLKVHGDSMNAARPIPILDGALIRCLSLEYGGVPLRSGHIAVIHRKRGDLVETTLKRVTYTGGAFEFRPESSNPDHRVFKPGDDESTEISAYAVVTGIFNAVDV